jgi:hypothetical protein
MDMDYGDETNVMYDENGNPVRVGADGEILGYEEGMDPDMMGESYGDENEGSP